MSIAQKTTKRTTTKAPDLDQPIRLKPVAAEEPAATPSLSEKVADVRNRHRGQSPVDVLTTTAEDLSIIIGFLELDSNANVPDMIITRMLEIQDVMYAVIEELEVAGARGAA